jgi:hypothetical protein
MLSFHPNSEAFICASGMNTILGIRLWLMGNGAVGAAQIAPIPRERERETTPNQDSPIKKIKKKKKKKPDDR